MALAPCLPLLYIKRDVIMMRDDVSAPGFTTAAAAGGGGGVGSVTSCGVSVAAASSLGIIMSARMTCLSIR